MYIGEQFSLSTADDIYSLLKKIDYIYELKHVNDEYDSLYIDFIRIVEEIEDNKYIKTYHDFMVGKKITDVISDNLEIDKLCARYLNITVDDFKKGLHKNIKSIELYNYKRWKKYVENKYDLTDNNTILEDTTEKSVSVSECRKNSKENIIRRDKVDTTELEEFVSRINKEIEKIKKEGKMDSAYRRKLTRIKIQVLKDINIIKKSNGEHIGKQNNFGRRTFTYYESDNPSYNYILQNHEKILKDIRNDYADEVAKQDAISEIKEVAKKVLTNRQYLIFDLYYLNGLLQREIAEIMGIKRNTVAENLSRIIDKIKKHVKTRPFC